MENQEQVVEIVELTVEELEERINPCGIILVP